LVEIEERALWRQYAPDFWAWFEKADLRIERREAERHMMVARAIPRDDVALSVGQYCAMQVVQYAKAAKRDAQEIIHTNGLIEGVSLSRHTRATLTAAIAKANLRNAASKPEDDATPHAEAIKQARSHASAWKKWAKKEGASPEVHVRERSGQVVVHIEILASELDLIMDDGDH
jgi:hypothetical protein